MIAFLLVAALFLVFAGIGVAVIGRLDPKAALRPAERLVVGTNAGALIGGFAVWSVGSAVFSAASMLGVLGALALAAVPGLRREISLLAGLRPSRPDAVTRALIALCVLLGVSSIVASFAPPVDADTLRYHFALARRDMELGRIASLYGWSTFDFFPQLGELLFRFALILGGPAGAHLVATGFVLLNAAGIAVLGRRAGLTETGAWAASLLYLALRTSIEQAGSGNVDHILASFVSAALLVLLAWRKVGGWGLMIIFGVLLGAATNVKYHGLVVVACLGLFAFADAVLRRAPLLPVVAAGAIAAALFVPIAVRNVTATGTPFFPLLNHVFNADGVAFYEGAADTWRPQNVIDVLLMPFAIFLQPGRFDGQQIGVPFLLMLMPFAPWARLDRRALGLLAAVFATYAVVWYLVTSLDVRYLVPFICVPVILAAAGAAAVWGWITDHAALRRAWIVVLCIGAAGQLLFFSATMLRRLPPVFDAGRVTAYLELPFFVNLTHYRACNFLQSRLAPGEKYLSILRSPTSFCPMDSLLVQFEDNERPYLYSKRPAPPLTPSEIAARLERHNVRFVLSPVDLETARPARITVQAVRLEFARFYTDAVVDAVATLQPVFRSDSALVFEAEPVIAALRGRVN